MLFVLKNLVTLFNFFSQNFFAKWALFICLAFYTSCATDPGTNSPVAGSATTYFTFSRGEMDIIVSVAAPRITVGVILFDVNTITHERTQATHVEEGVTIDWPSAVTVTIPNCSISPQLDSTETHETFKLFFYDFPAGCDTSVADNVSAFASLIIHKSGESRVLNDAGSQNYHKVFVTSGTYDGDLGGVVGADAKCQAEADTALLTGTWKAILSGSAENASDRVVIGEDAPVYNMIGEVVATGPGEFWSGTIAHELAYDVSGTLLPLAQVWTGSTSSGETMGNLWTCFDWSSSSALESGRWGMPGDTTNPGRWISANSSHCAFNNSLLCISQ